MGIYNKCISNKSIWKIVSTTIILKFSQSENNSINEETFKGLLIYSTRYVYIKSIKMLSLCYHESMGKIKENEGNKIFAGWWLYAK